MLLESDMNINNVKQRLIFNSLFVMAYEQFVSGWEDILLDFYADTIKFEDGEVIYEFSSKEDKSRFQKDIVHGYKNEAGKSIKGLSICKSLLNLNMIDSEDFDIFKEVHEKRNKFVHESPLLSQNISTEDKELFSKFLEIRSKASKRWCIEVECSTNPPEWNANYFDSNGNFKAPEDAFDLADLYFRAIADIALAEG